MLNWSVSQLQPVVLWLFSVRQSFGVTSQSVGQGTRMMSMIMKRGVGKRMSKRTRMSTGAKWTTKNVNNNKITIKKWLGRPIQG